MSSIFQLGNLVEFYQEWLKGIYQHGNLSYEILGKRSILWLGGVYMDTTLGKIDEQEEFFKELDKGIDDMENGRVLPHEETMKIIGERLRVYVQNTRIK